MSRVKDSDGNVLNGLIKSGGTIIVDSKKEYEKYKREREAALEIKNLKDEMSEIKEMLKLLLNRTKE